MRVYLFVGKTEVTRFEVKREELLEELSPRVTSYREYAVRVEDAQGSGYWMAVTDSDDVPGALGRHLPLVKPLWSKRTDEASNSK